MKLTTEELAEVEAAVNACPPNWEETETGFDIRTTPDERGISITVVHGEVSLEDLRDAIQEGDSLYTILSPAVRRLIANSRQWIPRLLAHIAEVEKENAALRGQLAEAKGVQPNAMALCKWVTDDNVKAAKDLIESCPGEILAICAALIELDITTRDHSSDLAADGFVLRAEEATSRADKYRESLNEIVEVWND